MVGGQGADSKSRFTTRENAPVGLEFTHRVPSFIRTARFSIRPNHPAEFNPAPCKSLAAAVDFETKERLFRDDAGPQESCT